MTSLPKPLKLSYGPVPLPACRLPGDSQAAAPKKALIKNFTWNPGTACDWCPLKEIMEFCLNRNKQMNQNFSIVYITLFALSLLVMGMALTYSNYEQFKEFTHEEIDRQLTDNARAIRERLEAKRIELEFLSFNPYISNILSGKTSHEARYKIRKYLSRVNKKLGLLAIFLLDDQGNCILSTNQRFEGNNYGFRPYFKQALEKGTGAYVALGVTSRKLGLYLSRRISGQQGRSGVLVAKLDPHTLFNSNKFLNGEGVSVWGATANGILFNAYREGFYSFEKSDPERLKTVRGNRQFEGEIHTLGFPGNTWSQLRKKGEISVQAAGESYHVEYCSILPGVFSVVSIISDDFKPLEIRILRRAFFLTNGAFILALVPMIGGIFIFWRQYEALLSERREKSKTQYRYKAILQGNKDGFVVMGPEDLTIEEFNDRFRDMLDFEEETASITGRPFCELLAQEDRKRFKNRLAEDTLNNFELDAHLVDARGHEVPVIIDFTRHNSGKPSISFCYAFIQDMRKGLKDARKIRLLETAVEQSGSSIIITDSDGTIQYVNPAFTRVTGYSVREASGQNPRFLKSGRHDHAFYENMWSAISSGHVWHARICNRKKDGELFWEDSTIAPVQDETGEITHYIAIKHDVTELVKLEEKLNQKVRELEGIMEHAGVAIALIQNRTFLTVNNTLARLLRLPKEEIIGKSTRILFEDEYDSIGQIFLPSLMKGETVYQQFEKVMPDGEKRWFQLTATAINPGPVEEMKVVGIGNDITQLKHLQKELEKQKIKAEEANRAKSAFLANMSHEIRTPLNGVIGMLSLLESTRLDEQQREYLQIAYSSAEALLFLINDILDISKIEAGKMEFDSVDFSLPGLIEDFSSGFAIAAEKKGIKYVVNVADDVPRYLKGDPGRLRQILINLTGNALKFTEKGQIGLTVELLRDLGDRALVKFSVRDTGIGIPEDKADRLFRKFSQVDLSISKKFGGTGLGLAISKKLAELMGGEIGVESQEGKGATFWFTVNLPKGAGKEETDAARKKKGTAPDGNELKLRGRVLVVEDNPVNQRVVTGFLRRIGVRAEVVNNGKEAVEVLEMIPYDLVLMDVQMPVMDGLSATRAIREPDSRVLDRQIPIVALTAHAFKEEVSRCMDAGMNDYLSKPIDPQKLIDILAKWLPRRPGGMSDDYEMQGPRDAAGAEIGEERNEPVFDREYLLKATMNDPGFGKKALELFLETGSGLLASLETAIEAGDAAEIMRVAHSIKGSSGSVGARRVAEIASIIEKEAKDGRPDNVAEKFVRLKEEFEIFREDRNVKMMLK